ncbi:MAG: outer membrane beta-barrel protein [Candidatus Dadabacteria bacterium]
MKRIVGVLSALLLIYSSYAQVGSFRGTVLDESSKPLAGASVQAIRHPDSLSSVNTSPTTFTVVSDKEGDFTISDLPLGYYQLKVSHVGLQTTTLDSIYVRTERFDFNIGEIILKQSTGSSLDEVVIYAEKPLIQSKDGNITFNAAESPLANSSNASDLLTNVPLVSKDPDGKLLVRGKEPKILIDDKPVELNMQQLQDLLESLPGSSIEKIEVMTNPPAQYANEQGGVINIVTRKGTVGVSGRVTVYTGSRGEQGANAGFNYRKQGLVLSANVGGVKNQFDGYGYSIRQNIYRDSSNHFNTNNDYSNSTIRPNVRLSADYDLNKFHSFNVVFQYNYNDFNNNSLTYYRNLNRYDDIYKLSNRTLGSNGYSLSPNLSLNYTLRTKVPGEILRIYTTTTLSNNLTDKIYYQQFFNPDFTFNGLDSSQKQLTDNKTLGYTVRVAYDRPLKNKKTSVSLGSFLSRSQSTIKTDATYKRKTDGSELPMDALSNHFIFHQDITNLRASVKQLINQNFSVSAGLSGEQTGINFDLIKAGADTSNGYWTLLPFANINKTWKDILNVSLAYRRTIRRPGINELNPTIDFSDPYNTRFGNPQLEASSSDNFDLVVGRTKNSFYANLGMGYNIVKNIYSQIRTLQPDGKTQITWQNISGRKEYEISSWSGYTINRKLRLNLSASYTYNEYSDFDKQTRKYRNGGSLTSSISSSYTYKDLYSATGNFTVNRFANPQGSVRSTLSMNLGVQARVLKKKVTIALNTIDPFIQQKNHVFTYGTNFNLESFSSTQTKNYRVSLSYNLTKSKKKTAKSNPLNKVKLSK